MICPSPPPQPTAESPAFCAGFSPDYANGAVPTYSDADTAWGGLDVVGPNKTVVEPALATVIEVFSGCPFKVAVAKDQFLHLKIKRTGSKSRFELVSKTLSELSDDQIPHIVFYNWHKIPRWTPGTAIANPYLFMTGTDYEYIEERDDVTFMDMYHMTDINSRYFQYGTACGELSSFQSAAEYYEPCYGGGEENLDTYLYVTIYGYFNEAPSGSGFYTLKWLPYASAQIPSEQREFMKELYYNTCFQTSKLTPIFDLAADDDHADLNRHWNLDDYQIGNYMASGKNINSNYKFRHVYNTSGGEYDSDTTPYCDWMFKRGLNPATGTFSDPVADATTCDDWDGIACDQEGNIIELQLSGKALKGQIPASISALTFVQKIYLSYNQLEGELPASIFTSEHLKELYVTKNKFTGEIPCMTHPEPKLVQMGLSRNHFTGGLKSCLFTGAPALRELFLSYNKLDTPIPPEIKEATQLMRFSAIHAGLHGPLPYGMMCLSKLVFLTLSRNKLSGELPTVITNGWAMIYSLNLAGNEFEGALPTLDEHTSALRYVDISDNKFSGTIHMQLGGFVEEQMASSGSSLAMAGNSFSGVLNETLFKALLTDAHSVGGLSASRNHMLCDPTTGNTEWPAWVFRFDTAVFGKCTPLATPTAAQLIVPGERLEITGTHFLPSDELKCKVGDTQYTASFVSSTTVLCGPMAEDVYTPGASYVVTVANYGQDFYSATLAGSSYAEVVALLPLPPPSPPLVDTGAAQSVSSDSSLETGAIVGIIVAVVVALLLLILVIFMITRERAGKPVFQTLETPSGGANVQMEKTNGAAESKC